MDIFTAHFFPTIRYMADWIQAENPVLDNYENFQKQSYRSRCCILSPNGKQRLYIPTQKHNKSRRIKDTKICYAEDWQKQHFKSLEAAYRSSPYFEFYEYLFIEVYNSKFEYLFDLNAFILERILKLMKIDDKIKCTNQYFAPSEIAKSHDFRDRYQAKGDVVNIPEYPQVFDEKLTFVPDLSIIDLLCNLGPESSIYLKNL